MKYTFIAGATSSLATALCHELARAGTPLILWAREAKELSRLKNDLQIRYDARIEIIEGSLEKNTFQPSDIIAKAEGFGQIGSFYSFLGEMGDRPSPITPKNLEQVNWVNYEAPLLFISALIPYLQKRKDGKIIVISSVAGDRGRALNFLYGAAKSALNTAISGLRQSCPTIHFATVKPGFIDTSMTFGMKKGLAMRVLISSRNAAAKTIARAVARKRHIIYTPWYWQVIMAMLCMLPEWLFKRVKI